MEKNTPKSRGGGALTLLEQRVRARTQDLQNANRAAQNVLEDLQIEKEKLAVAGAKDEALLESIGDGVIATDEGGIIVLVNKAAEKFLLRKSSELIGKMFSEAIIMEDELGLPIPTQARPIVRTLTLGTATTAAVADPIHYYVRKDKTKFPVAITVTPVILGGKVVGSIEVFRDITKEREIDRAKTEFVSLASHQLRTPLSSVRWYLDMLLDGDAGVVNKKQKQYLEEIHHGNLRMINLVNTLLHVSQFELGLAQVHSEKVALQDVVSDVLEDMEFRRLGQNISIETHIPSSLVPLTTDARLVRIAVENLISNAIKYTGANGQIEITAQEIPAGHSFDTQIVHEKSIGLSIADTGIGIPLAQQGEIFKKLFRAENAREVDTGGAGLGLYLTRLVLERLGGRVWFKSRERAGSSFYLLLPCSALTQEEDGTL